jgi:hypothetical protein
MSLFKHWKPPCILSFIIHWNVFQFVEAIRTMVQVNMKESCFWDRLGWLFICHGCGSCGVGDGMKLVDNIDKKTS